MADRAAEIARLLKSLSESPPQPGGAGVHIHFHGPVIVGPDPGTLAVLRVLLRSHLKDPPPSPKQAA